MDAYPSESALRSAAQRFTDMPLSGLIAEWEERLTESERPLLIEELKARGYRIKSLPPPASDIPDGDRAAATRLREHQLARMGPLQPMHSIAGATACYLIVAAIFLAPAFHLGSLLLVLIYLSFGIAIHRGSGPAAFGALLITGLMALGVTLLLLLTASQGHDEAWIWIGVGTLFLTILGRIASFLWRTKNVQRDSAG